MLRTIAKLDPVTKEYFPTVKRVFVEAEALPPSHTQTKEPVDAPPGLSEHIR